MTWAPSLEVFEVFEAFEAFDTVTKVFGQAESVCRLVVGSEVGSEAGSKLVELGCLVVVGSLLAVHIGPLGAGLGYEPQVEIGSLAERMQRALVNMADQLLELVMLVPRVG